MKKTTDSQLADQAYHDYQKVVEPSDERANLAHTANTYAAHFGVPLRLDGISSPKLAGVMRYVLRNFDGLKMAAANSIKGVVYLSSGTRWLCTQITEAWDLK